MQQSLEQLKEMCDTLRKNNQPPFLLGMLLSESDYLEYHYSFIYGDDSFSKTVWHCFNRHYDEGISFLLTKIIHEPDCAIRAKIIMMLGKMTDELLKNQNVKITDALPSRVLALILDYAQNGSDTEREKTAIVLGWIGRLPQIELLGKLMLHDSYEKVRAWAASSFMQMSFRVCEQDNEVLKKAAVKYFYKAFLEEPNLYAVGIMLSSFGTIYNKNFRLSEKAIDDVDAEKIQKARASAIRFIEKML